jgi:hypothetical protein
VVDIFYTPSTGEFADRPTHFSDEAPAVPPEPAVAVPAHGLGRHCRGAPRHRGGPQLVSAVGADAEHAPQAGSVRGRVGKRLLAALQRKAYTEGIEAWKSIFTTTIALASNWN